MDDLNSKLPPPFFCQEQFLSFAILKQCLLMGPQPAGLVINISMVIMLKMAPSKAGTLRWSTDLVRPFQLP